MIGNSESMGFVAALCPQNSKELDNAYALLARMVCSATEADKIFKDGFFKSVPMFSMVDYLDFTHCLQGWFVLQLKQIRFLKTDFLKGFQTYFLNLSNSLAHFLFHNA